MKTNVKAVIAVLIIVGIIFWAVSSLRTRTYNGANLTFEAGGGTITVMNPSSETLPVKFTGRQSASFTVSSSIAGVAGRSTKSTTGSTSAQVFEFNLPPGTSEFTLLRSLGVMFAASTDVNLEASVQPVDASTSRTTLIATIVVVLAALYYISSLFEHRWMSQLPGRGNLMTKVIPAPAGENLGQGNAAKAYGDNRLR
jgi:hypothetical protein